MHGRGATRTRDALEDRPLTPFRGKAHVSAGGGDAKQQPCRARSGPDLEMADHDVVAAGRPAHPLLHGRTGHLVLEHGSVARQAHSREPALIRGQSAHVRPLRARARASGDPRGPDVRRPAIRRRCRWRSRRAHRAAEAPSDLPASCGQADGTSPAPAPSASHPCPTTPRPRAAGPGRTRPTDRRQPARPAPAGRDSWPEVWRQPRVHRGPTRRTARRPRATAPSPDGGRAQAQRAGRARRRRCPARPGRAGHQAGGDAEAMRAPSEKADVTPGGRRSRWHRQRAVRSSRSWRSSLRTPFPLHRQEQAIPFPPLVLGDAMAKGTFQAYRGDGIASWRAWGCRMTTRRGWPSATRVGRISRDAGRCRQPPAARDCDTSRPDGHAHRHRPGCRGQRRRAGARACQFSRPHRRVGDGVDR